MNIVILGPGAVGTLWAAKLINAGHRVSLWARQVDATLCRQLDDAPLMHIRNRDVTALNQADLLLVTVKAWQVLAAITPLVPHIAPQTIITLMHNGMGTAERVEQCLPHNPIVLATTTHGALAQNAQQVKHTGHGFTQLGGFNASGQQCAFLREVFDHALAPVEWHSKVKQVLWQKLAVNCAINPMTALHNIRNGELASAKYQRALQALYHELSLVMNAEGITTNAGTIQTHVEQVYNATANNFSSMQQDIVHQRPSEIDYITGYLLSTAQRHGIHTPANQALYDAIIAKQLMTKASHQEEAV